MGINIVIPMAGMGSRFKEAGYTFPKPLVEVRSEPMIKVVVDNIGIKGRYVFLVLREHYGRYALKYLLPLICKDNPCEIVVVDQITQGSACTVLLAEKFINNESELLIANSDQWVSWSPDHFLDYNRKKGADGSILTFHNTHPKWSFARLDDTSSKIVEVAEKRPISNLATVGIYWFKKGSDFVTAAKEMIAKDDRTNGEFYTCPAYNYLIAAGKTVLNYPIAEMRGLGTPEDLQAFLESNHEDLRFPKHDRRMVRR